MFDCAGDKTKKCKCRIIPEMKVLTDWSKKVLYSKGQKLCGRGGGKCLHSAPFIPPKKEVILHLYPEVYMERN
jgi:hypothetical protein